jgi:predicted phage terminase large subunit-like protein
VSFNEIAEVVAGVDAELARRYLADFVQQAWPVLEPQTQLQWNWHHDAICRHIQAALEAWEHGQLTGQTPAAPPAPPNLQNLLINEPPGSMKSRILCVMAPAWMWVRCPHWRVICIASNPRVAMRDAVYCRELIKSQWYRQTFQPQWEFSEDQDSKSHFMNSRGGFRMAIGVGAHITGDRADAIFIDDPHDVAEVNSDLIRVGVLDWWDQAACNRVNDLRRSIRIGIMQRLHEEDWAGHVLQTGQWEHLCIPQEFVPGHRQMGLADGKLIWRDQPTRIGWTDPRIHEGELLFPQREPAHVIAQEKRRLGSVGYSGQHQQDPMAAGGNKFKKDWFRYFTEEDGFYHLQTKNGVRRVTKSSCQRYAIGDFAFTTKTTSDYTVIGIFDVTPTNDVLIVGWERHRIEDPEVERLVEKVWEQWHPLYVGIEDKQNGTTIIQRLIQKGRVMVKAIPADADKITRSIPAQIDLENGKIFFAEGAQWLAELESELLRFPNGVHDDQVDVLAHAVRDISPSAQDWSAGTQPYNPNSMAAAWQKVMG